LRFVEEQLNKVEKATITRSEKQMDLTKEIWVWGKVVVFMGLPIMKIQL
jgi:hypothetical protein